MPIADRSHRFSRLETEAVASQDCPRGRKDG
jgi:hypothetical protein